MNTKVIHKFPVKPEGRTVFFSAELPADAKFLHVQQQGDAAQMWWMLDPREHKFKRVFRIVATGEKFVDDDLDYLATFFFDGGAYVFHLFEVDRSCTRCGKPRDETYTFDGKPSDRMLCKGCGKTEDMKPLKEDA